ncbi:MAG: protein-glutamate O-methyltransferase CheR [Gammaproteobacteria bacterium]|nr:protein-glutamate O-methyltransferase CheR [Gammaproteobacteria bacterium]
MAYSTEDGFQITQEDYQQFQAFLQDACGIVLGDNKQYLVANRMRRILDELQINSLGLLVQRIGQNPRSGLKESVINAMTTNETFWFRDALPFDALRDVILPQLLADGVPEPLRLWSAACSSGQEPYSLSMIIEEFKRKYPAALRREPSIVATDISSAVLNAARQGSYDRLSLRRGLSDGRLAQFFDENADRRYSIKPAIAARVDFRFLNLLDSFAVLGTFDVVFCRNVLIYFSAARKQDILRRIRATLRPGGCLALGASESLPIDLKSLYQIERADNGSTFYRAS